jgi:septum formation protein
VRTAAAQTAVEFRALDRDAIDAYVRAGEWEGRAGAYAIQGRGATLVQRIEGDYLNVVGLPVPTLLDLAPHLLADAHGGSGTGAHGRSPTEAHGP